MAAPAAVWFLTMKLFGDGEPEMAGPFTEQECVQCGELMDKKMKELAKRLGRKPTPGFICMPQEPGEPPHERVRRTCEGS